MSHSLHTSPSRAETPGRRGPIGPMRLVLAALLVVLLFGLSPAGAQDAIEEAREERENTRLAQLKARAALDVLDAEWEDVQAAFEAADELVRLAEARAEAVEAQIKLAETRLRQIEVGIAWAEFDRERVGEELTDLAIRQYLGISDDENLLAADDLNAAMTRNTVLDVVQGAGYDVIDTARSAADRHAELKVQAEIELATIQELEAELESELEELNEALEVRERALDALNGRRSEWLDRVDELEAEEQRLTDLIRAEQRQREVGAALDAQRSAEGYVWPTAGGIGSYFGNRLHPILGYYRLHGGLDIGGLMGQPIWAAKEGLVILAGVHGGYGNTIVIDHGNGLSTLYGHQASFVVGKGDYVETGQHIGNVGSTGLSTGPHLHFEVRVNGDVVDPLPFLPPR